nr:DUF2332 domain-containing protein [Caldalkalibacillus salinus]
MEPNIKVIAKRFRTFATEECRGSSELYAHLSLRVSETDDILTLATYTREGQPIPNLLFGAVHYLLLKGYDHPLQDFYPSLIDQPRDVEAAFPYFKDFCQQFAGDIIPILKNRCVQTNEVSRCAYLYPVFSHLYDQVKKPLALIEIGTSAGLQLLWDQYRYSYGTHDVYGHKQSNVHIESRIHGDNKPKLPHHMPTVASRVGVDLNILDLETEEDALWLKALIWPEHQYRRALIEKAASCVKAHPLTLVEGDGVALLPNLVKQIPKEHCICVFHTHVANQMSQAVKERLLEHVRQIGEKRDIGHLYNNIQDRDLHLDYYVNGEAFTKVVGRTDGHGRWFTWGI